MLAILHGMSNIHVYVLQTYVFANIIFVDYCHTRVSGHQDPGANNHQVCWDQVSHI
jgi:hypothetical protein